MTKLIKHTLAAAILMALASGAPTFAHDHEKELKGKALCAKCELKKSDKCETLIQVEEGSEKVTYHLAPNEVAKQFHSKICSSPKKVAAKGEVKEKDGKRHITLSKIEVKE